jgi:pimeloyl-ACP methyl ester carboxylesterase
MNAAPVQPRRRTFTIQRSSGTGEIAAIEFGDAARPIDVIFLHANGFNALTYRDALGPLAGKLRILAIDHQGHGLSPQRDAAEDRINWLGYRDDLMAILDQINGPPVVLSGHSMGGAVSVLTAAERPGQVKALALFDPVIMADAVVRDLFVNGPGALENSPLAVGARRRRAVFASRDEALQAYRGRGGFKTWPELALVDYIADGFRDRADGQVELACAPEWEVANFTGHLHDVRAALHQVRCPVTILRAEQGSTCSVDSSDDFVADNPAFIVQTIPGATHFLPIERPDLVRAVLLKVAGEP